MAEERDIKYINKDFSDFRNQLVEHAKNYFLIAITIFLLPHPV